MHVNLSMHSPLLDLEASFRYEYAVVQQAVVEYIGEVSDLLTLLPKRREKRGLIDAGGSVIKFLFGNPDHNDLDEIDGKINHLYYTTEEIAHDNQEQVTVLANMQNNIVTQTQTINKIINTLKEYHKIMHSTLATVFRGELIARSQINQLLKYTKLNSALNDIKDTVNNAIRRVTRLHLAIEDLAKGKVSSNLLPPHEYLRILEEVERVVMPPTKLYTPVNLENIYKYYAAASVQSYTTVHTLRVVIQVPLKTDEQTFEMYNVITYPVFDVTLERWVRWEVDDSKLLVSQDRLMYTVYEEADFNHECLPGQLTVCPLRNVLLSTHKRPNCAVELFTQEKIAICKRKIVLEIQSPVLIRTPARWLYSTSTEHRVTLNCYESNGNMNVTTRVLNGVGEVTQAERCDLISDEFKVPARIHGSSLFVDNLFLGMPRVRFPDVDSFFNSDETEVLTMDLNATRDVLKGLDDELGTLGMKEYHLEGVLHRLRSQYFWQRSKGSRAVVGGGVTVVVLLMLCVLSFRKRERFAAWCAACHAWCHKRQHAAAASALEAVEVPDAPYGQGVPLEQKDVEQDELVLKNETATAAP